MTDSLFGDPPSGDRIPERDVVAMVAMLDYLISEVSRIDETGAQCLVLARKSLSDAAAGESPRTH